jgi:molybdopterin biosynthesis enzyme
MIPITEAIKIIERETSLLNTEKIDLEVSVGRILAENIKADMSLPPFDRSQMDGFAVKSDDTKKIPTRLVIVGESVAGNGFDRKLKPHEAVRIMTGARVPEGADAVQKVELTKENYGFVEILETAKPLQNINKCASEVKKGEKVFSKGEIIDEQMIATLASFGYEQVRVFQQPQVSIFATGSEIVEISETPKKDQIRNSNSMMLKVLAKNAGAKPEILPMVEDSFDSIKEQISKAVGLEVEIPISKLRKMKELSNIENQPTKILIITGGVSVGDYDFTKPVLRELGAKIFFEQVSLKPGKPTVFAKLTNTLIFGLPGNPVSSAVTFYLFVRHAIMQMQGAKNCELKRGTAIVSNKIKSAKERDCFLPVSLSTNENGFLIIESLRFSGSSNFIQFARANALVFVPQGKNLEKDETAEILFL